MIEFSLTLKDAVSFSIVRFVEAIQGVPETSVVVGVRGHRGQELIRYAAVNEFGSADGHIPERSYLRSTVDRNGAKYAQLLTEAVEHAVDLSPNAQYEKLAQLGAIAAGDVQLTITELRSPPNAPSTIRAKGSDNPLIDTGRLRQSIDYEVRTTLVRIGEDVEV